MCKHMGAVSMMGFYKIAPLADGHHTSFRVLRCHCGAVIGFPQRNLDMALKEGTEETKAKLQEIMAEGRRLICHT